MSEIQPVVERQKNTIGGKKMGEGVLSTLLIIRRNDNDGTNVSVQYDGGFLPDIILLTQCYYHRGTRLNAMKRFCIFSY